MARLTASLSTVLAVRLAGASQNQNYDSFARSDFGEDEAFQQMTQLDAGATNVAVPMGQLLTARTLLVVSSQAITITLNGEPVTAKCLLIDGALVTSISLANPGLVAAQVRILALGS